MHEFLFAFIYLFITAIPFRFNQIKKIVEQLGNRSLGGVQMGLKKTMLHWKSTCEYNNRKKKKTTTKYDFLFD